MSERELTRLLCLRSPGQRYRFVLEEGAVPELRIERLRGRVPVEAEIGGLAGAVLVSSDFKLLFCSRGDQARLLSDVAAWTRAIVPRLPAAAALIGAGTAAWDGDPGDDKAIEAIDTGALRVHREDALWAGIADASVGGVAAVLGSSLPGERLWYWMTAVPGQVGLPLLVQPVAGDPHRDAINTLIDVAERSGAGRAASGIAYVTDDGSIQFVGPRLQPEMLVTLAGWVRESVEKHPAVARLVGCRLLRAGTGRVESVIENPEFWNGVSRPTVPATAAETEGHLAALQPGQECWFWMTETAPEGVFLSVVPRSEDPDAITFGLRVQGLYRRFPDSFREATVGVVRRRGTAGLVFETAQARAAQWATLRQRLAERHPAVGASLATAGLIAGEATVGAR